MSASSLPVEQGLPGSYAAVTSRADSTQPLRRLLEGIASPKLTRALHATWTTLWQGTGPLALRKRKRLRVSETLSLGDKRFVSILEVDGQSFLIGGSGAGLSLLASLTPATAPFARVLGEALEEAPR